MSTNFAYSCYYPEALNGSSLFANRQFKLRHLYNFLKIRISEH